jgi:hypothetical protein
MAQGILIFWELEKDGSYLENEIKYDWKTDYLKLNNKLHLPCNYLQQNCPFGKDGEYTSGMKGSIIKQLK